MTTSRKGVKSVNWMQTIACSASIPLSWRKYTQAQQMMTIVVDPRTAVEKASRAQAAGEMAYCH